MTAWRRIREILIGIVLVLISLLLFIAGGQAYPIVIAIYAVLLVAAGVRTLIYFFSMARYMVGGKSILYRGILMIDLGAFAGGLVNVPQIYILLYLCGTLAFSGVIGILRAMESKKIGGSWKLKFSMGVVSVLIAILCVIFMRTTDKVVYIFCIALIYSAAERIINAFRTSPVLIIQ